MALDYVTARDESDPTGAPRLTPVRPKSGRNRSQRRYVSVLPGAKQSSSWCQLLSAHKKVGGVPVAKPAPPPTRGERSSLIICRSAQRCKHVRPIILAPSERRPIMLPLSPHAACQHRERTQKYVRKFRARRTASTTQRVRATREVTLANQTEETLRVAGRTGRGKKPVDAAHHSNAFAIEPPSPLHHGPLCPFAYCPETKPSTPGCPTRQPRQTRCESAPASINGANSGYGEISVSISSGSAEMRPSWASNASLIAGPCDVHR